MSGRKLLSNSLPVLGVKLLYGIVVAVCGVWFSSGILQAQSDTQPPQLLSLSLTPPTVDVTASDQVVSFAAHITDNLSGVSSTEIQLVNPSGAQRVFGFGQFQPGIILDGMFQIPVTVPRYAEPGTWRVDSLFLWDNVGNFVSINTAALNAAGFPTTVQVQDANPDVTAPQVQSFSLSPSSIDVSAGSQTINVDLVLTDDLSGVATNPQFFSGLQLTSPSGKQTRTLVIWQFQLVAGTINNGSFHTVLDMPRYSEPGVWKVSALWLLDKVSNQRFYDATALTSFGSSIQVTVSSNPSDTTPPQLTGLTIIPSVINTSLSNQNVEVEFAITDDLSGASFGEDSTFFSQFSGGYFSSPSGAQYRFTGSFSNAPPISGVPTNGVWRFPVFFPRFSEEGTWKITVILKDAVRNVALYSPTQLAALGFSTDLIVIRPTLVPDGTISNPAAGGSISDNTFGDRAKVIVPPAILSQSTTIAIDVLQSPLQVPLPVGFSGAETYFVNIEFLPTPVFPLPAPGLTVVLPLRNFTIPGTAINLFRIDPATGNLVPALNTSGNPVIGLVDAGGLSATFQGISRLSTVVGLLPDVIPVRIAVQQQAINTKSHGNIPVVIFSSPALDATKIDPSTLRFGGASVETHGRGKFQISTPDADGDGLPDLLSHFKTEELLLTPADTQGVLEGRTFDNRRIRGVAPVRIIK